MTNGREVYASFTCVCYGKIDRLEEILLLSGKSVPISRKYYKELKKRYQLSFN